MSLQARDSLNLQLSPVSSTDNRLDIANYVWDTNTLSWVRATVGAGGGPTSSVDVISTVGLTNAQLRASPVPVSFAPTYYTQRVDDLDTTLYVGKAVVASSEAASVWQIKRITFTGPIISTTWAAGSSDFNQSWSNRASLSYI